MAPSKKFTVAALATDGFQEVELAGPMQALRDAGAQVDIISDRKREVEAFENLDVVRKYPVTKTIEEARVADYAAVFTPGAFITRSSSRPTRASPRLFSR